MVWRFVIQELEMIRAGICGATGYTGYELVGLLRGHPAVEIVFATSASNAGKSLRDLYAGAPRLPLVAPEEAPMADVDLVFLCLPHAAAAETAVKALGAGARVIDLSADFRIRDVGTYESWYGGTHPAPALLDEAVYGLTEHAGEALDSARLVANPGCYATSVLLPTLPLLAAGAITSGQAIIADSKSGVSGAGRKPQLYTHFVEANEGFSAYSVGRAHRHHPEMLQEMRAVGGSNVDLIFSPHLLPVERGVLSTIYLPLADGWTAGQARETLEERYADAPFVEVLPEGELASLGHVQRSNRSAIGLTDAGRTLIATSALDNLVKGAAGQAVQNMNRMYRLDETLGLGDTKHG
jgi:N-acetyl-gamma-glutamyl-phosphate reductase